MHLEKPEQRKQRRELDGFSTKLQHYSVNLYSSVKSRRYTIKMEAQVDELESHRENKGERISLEEPSQAEDPN